MSTATAEYSFLGGWGSSHFRIDRPKAWVGEIIERQIASRDTQLRGVEEAAEALGQTAIRIVSLLRPLTKIPAPWLGVVEERIRASVPNVETPIDDSAAYIQQSVAENALWLLRQTSDLLPIEPYLHSGEDGNLAINVVTDKVHLTLLVCTDRTLISALMLGDYSSAQYDIDLTRDAKERVRSALLDIRGREDSRAHGGVEARPQ